MTDSLPPADAEAIRRAIADGRIIEAAKQYRAVFGCGMREAKEAIDRLRDNPHQPIPGPGDFSDDRSQTPAVRSATPEDLQPINDALFAGRKIEAIKHYRELTGCSLIEAKDFVETLERRLRDEFPDRFDSDPPRRSGCGTVVLGVMIAVGVLRGLL